MGDSSGLVSQDNCVSQFFERAPLSEALMAPTLNLYATESIFFIYTEGSELRFIAIFLAKYLKSSTRSIFSAVSAKNISWS